MDILQKIIRNKQKEVASRKEMIPAGIYESFPGFKMSRPSFSAALRNNYPSVIAEFKRRSPSKGLINETAGIYETITGYERAGVNAVSVLTDSVFFGGSLCDLQDASTLTSVPLLRKDFIIDQYQIFEARAYGASAILLIASVLSKEEVSNLSLFARSLELEVLFEIHEEVEIDKWDPAISMVGINNRNLSTFDVNMENSVRLAGKLPGECIKVAESGITSPDTVKGLYKAGFNAFLIGEAFMKTSEPWVTAGNFISDLRST
jgi:indole-3-glycerol phosphate synthase